MFFLISSAYPKFRTDTQYICTGILMSVRVMQNQSSKGIKVHESGS